MKPLFDENTDKNFKKACLISETQYTHAELINMLESGDIMQKQLAAIELDTIIDAKEAGILLNNLTGCDGKIREAVAYRIFEITKKNKNISQLFIAQNLDIVSQIFANATIDINANICKYVLAVVNILKTDENFAKLYTEKIVSIIYSAFEEINKFIYKDKKYVINKQLFKLYWGLEALNVCQSSVEKTILNKILNRAMDEQEYTIREKVAQILSKTDDKFFEELIEKVKKDENFYVRKAIDDNLYN